MVKTKIKKASSEKPSTQEEIYKLTGNPLIVWDALLSYKAYHDNYNPDFDPAYPETYEPPPIMPQWIMDYLGRTAQELLKIDTPMKQAYSEIRRALGIKDARIFSTFNKDRLTPAAINALAHDEEDRKDLRAGDLGGLAYNVWCEVLKEQENRREQRKKKIKTKYKYNVYETIADRFGIGEVQARNLFKKFNKIYMMQLKIKKKD